MYLLLACLCVQVTRCLGLVKDLLSLLSRLSTLTAEEALRDESLLRTLDSKASTLAASLTARRFYFKVRPDFNFNIDCNFNMNCSFK
jgi:hypothetical protein